MSSWWSIKLFAVGDFNRLEEFENALPSLFHVVAEADRANGAVAAYVAQNYGGEAAIEDAIGDYPDLIFSGVMTHDQADVYSCFTAAKGQADWTEFSIPEKVRPVVPAIELTRLDNKIARLTRERELFIDQLEKSKSSDRNTTGPTADPTKGKDVRAILDKIKSGAEAKRA